MFNQFERGHQKVCVVRMDDWYERGDAILAALAESGKRVYPAEAAAAMCDLWRETADLAHGGSPVGSRLARCVRRFRAWTYWPVGAGMEEGDIDACLAEVLTPLLGDPALHLPKPGPPPGR